MNLAERGNDSFQRFGGEDVLRIVVSEQLDVVLPGEGDELGRDDAAALQVDLNGLRFDSRRAMKLNEILSLDVTDAQRIDLVLVDQIF